MSDKTAAKGTSPKTPETDLAQMCLVLAGIERNLAGLISATNSGSRTDVAVARLDNQDTNDVVLVCDIKLVSKQGTIASISSENTLPGALETHMLSASHGNFCHLLEAVITNPLVSSFQSFLTKKAKSDKILMPKEAFGDADLSGFLVDDD